MMPGMVDPKFNDPTRWELVEDVNVFDEHTDRRGDKVVRKFTRADLEKIAEKCNHRDRIGQHCPLTLGHTKDDAKEKDQPEIVGYARKFRVAFDATLNRHVIRATYYLRRDRAEEAREYPRISVEYWPDGKFFDPIALLRRTPQRDLGQWTYHRRGKAKAACVRYAMGEQPMADEFEDDKPGRGGDPTGPPSKDDTDDDPRRTDEPDGDEDGRPEDVEPEFHAKVMKCMRGKYKHFDDIYKEHAKKYEMGSDNDDPDADPNPDTEGESEDAVDPKKKAPVADQMARAGNVARMAKMEQELAELRKEVRTARLKEAEAGRLDVVRRMTDAGYRIGQPEKVVQNCRRMSDKEFADHIEYLAEIAPKDPASGPGVEVARQSPVGRYAAERQAEIDNDPDTFTESDFERANDYLRQHPGCEWEEAEKYAKENRPKRFAARKEVAR